MSTSISRSRRGRRGSRARSTRSNGGLATAVPAENPGRRKFTELVPDHVFLHKHLQELVAVVHFKRVTDELRNDRARPSPGLDGLLGAVLVELRNLLEKLLVNERTFFCASAHGLHAHRLRSL